MSVEPEQMTEGQGSCPQFPPQHSQGEIGTAASAAPCVLPIDDRPDPANDGPEAPKAEVGYLQLKLEEAQTESSLLKEWGARIEMYVDCLVDALESNHISHVYDVDGSLVSLDECRQKAKTLPHTRKPHCDEDIRTKQYEAEIDELRQEVEALTTDLEDALQRSTEQDYLLEALRTAEYQANRRWEVYHENVMQQWSKCFADLQGRHKDTVGRLQRLGVAFDNLKRSTAGRHLGGGGFNRVDPFRRYRPAPPRHDVFRAGPFQQQRQMTAPLGDRPRGNSSLQGRGYRDRSDFTPALPRAERAAILKQFFANLNMIQRRQQEYAAAGRRGRPRHELRHRQPGPYGEAR